VDPARLSALLEQVAAGEVTISHALDRLRHMPVADLDFARLDMHRAVRTGFPEVVFGLGKSPDQVASICERLIEHHERILATRISPETAEYVLARLPGLEYHADARALTAGYPGRRSALAGSEQVPVNSQAGRDAGPTQDRVAPASAGRDAGPTQDRVAPASVPATVAVLCAGTADIPVAAEAALTVEMRGVAAERLYDVGVAGLHRVLEALPALDRAKAIVVVAGMEGALPSVVGGLVDKPVIAVPTSVGYGASFGGLAALLGMLNSCAAGVSVVNIDNGFGAGYLAGLIAQNTGQT
jgi:NCAIR mutase (PurE)-related protein